MFIDLTNDTGQQSKYIKSADVPSNRDVDMCVETIVTQRLHELRSFLEFARSVLQKNPSTPKDIAKLIDILRGAIEKIGDLLLNTILDIIFLIEPCKKTSDVIIQSISDITDEYLGLSTFLEE